MSQLFVLKIFLKLSNIKEALFSELVNPVGPSNLNLITRLWLLSLTVVTVTIPVQHITVNMSQVPDQGIEVVQLRLSMCITELCDVVHDVLVEFDNLLQEVVDLSFGLLEAAILMVKVPHMPHCILIQFRCIEILPIHTNEWNIVLLDQNLLEYFLDLVLGAGSVDHLSKLLLRIRHR